MTPLIVRALWAALAMLGIASALLLVVRPTLDPEIDSIVPISVAEMKPDLGADTVRGPVFVMLPEWNIFAENGEPWQQVQAPAAAATPDRVRKAQKFNADGIKGSLRMPGLEGVMTDQGFVAVGGSLEGAEILSLQNGEIVVSTSGQEQSVVVNPTRQQRKAKFEAIGFPFLDADGLGTDGHKQ